MSARLGDGKLGLAGISFCLDMTQATAQIKSSYVNPDSIRGKGSILAVYNNTIIITQ